MDAARAKRGANSGNTGRFGKETATCNFGGYANNFIDGLLKSSSCPTTKDQMLYAGRYDLKPERAAGLETAATVRSVLIAAGNGVSTIRFHCPAAVRHSPMLGPFFATIAARTRRSCSGVMHHQLRLRLMSPSGSDSVVEA